MKAPRRIGYAFTCELLTEDGKAVPELYGMVTLDEAQRWWARCRNDVERYRKVSEVFAIAKLQAGRDG